MNHRVCKKPSGASVALSELADPVASGLTCDLSVLTSSETIVDRDDYYGDIITGYFKAPVSGQYTFFASGDDNFEVSMNLGNVIVGDTMDPAGIESIISLNRHTSYRDYSTYSTWKTVTLEQDKYYYIQALHIEGGGSDHFSMAVKFLNPGVTNHHNSIKEIQRL